MTKHPGQKSRRPLARAAIFLACSTLLVLVASLLTLFWSMQQRQHARAEDPTVVVGTPSVPATTVEQILAGSPMEGTGQVIEDAARRTSIDDAFALGVWWAETNFGAAGVGLGYHNPGGVRASSAYPEGGSGFTVYPTYADAVNDWFDIVKSRYIDRGLTTVYTISGPYVGTAESGTWANKVYNLMTQYRAMVPPPTPTPTPSPTPTPKPRDWEQEQRPVTTVHTQKAATPVSSPERWQASNELTVPTFSFTGGQGVLAGGGLLLALVLFGYGCMLRLAARTGGEPTTAPLPVPATLGIAGLARPLPPLYGTPVVGQSPFAVDSSISTVGTGYAQAFMPALSAQPGASPSNKDQFTHAQFEGGLRRVRLRTTEVRTEHLASDMRETTTESLTNGGDGIAGPAGTTIGQRIVTEGLPPYRPGITLRGREKTVVGVGSMGGRSGGEGQRGGGLLARYGDNAREKQDEKLVDKSPGWV